LQAASLSLSDTLSYVKKQNGRANSMS
jgi:hypothetical protein